MAFLPFYQMMLGGEQVSSAQALSSAREYLAQFITAGIMVDSPKPKGRRGDVHSIFDFVHPTPTFPQGKTLMWDRDETGGSRPGFMPTPGTVTDEGDARNRSGATAAGYVWGTVFRLMRGLVRKRRQRDAHAVAGEGQSVVACLGASETDARGSYDWIHDLAQRPTNAHLRFHRFAEGGDLAYNGLGRVPDIVACRPNYVVILLGGNDVLALIANKHAQFVRMTKHLPTTPSPGWYCENMQTIVRRLKSGTNAWIGLCSLTPIGEDPSSSDPFQAQANRRIEEYSATLRAIAHEEAVSYIPVYERMHELILACPGRAFAAFDILPFYRDVFRQFVLHMSDDEIGQLNGWRYHRDGLHLNSRSGKLLADLVQSFLDTAPGVAAPW